VLQGLTHFKMRAKPSISDHSSSIAADFDRFSFGKGVFVVQVEFVFTIFNGSLVGDRLSIVFTLVLQSLKLEGSNGDGVKLYVAQLSNYLVVGNCYVTP
jgi:hypothetical protein